MKYYVAPLEGITGYIFRNALNEYFGEGIDKFYAPFIMPHVKRAFSQKELNEIAPDNNKGINLVPQILTDNADDFTRLKEEFRSLGYEEINLNLGCPSGTVTAKGRGAAMLSDVNRLDRFLSEIYASGDDNISIKTRIGVCDIEEFDRILEIYKQYPVRELIIHPRVLDEMYKGKAHRDIFYNALKSYRGQLCYNGDVFCENDLTEILKMVDITNASNETINSSRDQKPENKVNITCGINIMLGRGILRDPSLIMKLRGQNIYSQEEINKKIYSMLCKLKNDYSSVFSGSTPVLFKLKEVWSYLCASYPNDTKNYKKLMKSRNLEEYDIYAREILRI